MATTVYKQLATMQDLTPSYGKVIQRRNGVDVELDKIGLGFTVPTIADLRNTTGLFQDQVANVLGYYTPGDVGGGPPRIWKTGGAYVDNGGSVITPGGVPGPDAWIWEWSGPKNVLWYGAGTSDPTAILQAVFDMGGSIYIPEGDYNSTSMLYVRVNGTTIYGDGKGVTNLRFAGTGGIKCEGPNLQDISIHNIQIIGNYATSNTIGLQLDRVIRGASFSDIFIRGFGTDGDFSSGVFVGKGDGTLGTWSIELENITVEQCGRGFVIIESQNVTLIACVSRLNFGDSFYSRDWITGAIVGGTFENSDSTRATNSIALNMQDTRDISISGIYTENSIDEVVRLNNCRGITFSGCRLNGFTSIPVSDTHIMINLVNNTVGCIFTGSTIDSISSLNQSAIVCDSTTKFNTFSNITISVPLAYIAATIVDDRGFQNKFSSVTRFGTSQTYVGNQYVEFTPTITFQTNGDFAPTATTLNGRLKYLTDKTIFVEIVVSFTANAYATASGQLIIGGLPVTSEVFTGMIVNPLNLSFSGHDYSGSNFQDIRAINQPNTDEIKIQGITATSYTFFGVANIQPSTTHNFYITGVISIY